MTPEPTAIPGCAVVPLPHHRDDRGELVKIFQASVVRPANAELEIAEVFWSRSRRGVVRGLHFQVPPHAHTKLVSIVSGRAIDAIVDLRAGTPTYGTHVAIDLDADAPVAVVVPVGCAHGFQALVDNTVVVYATTTEHAPDADGGIRWDSAGFDWPLVASVVSPRDAAFPTLAAFASPFTGSVRA